jgi:hypothetical protein
VWKLAVMHIRTEHLRKFAFAPDPSQCHGLAGTAEFFLELHRLTRSPVWRDRAGPRLPHRNPGERCLAGRRAGLVLAGLHMRRRGRGPPLPPSVGAEAPAPAARLSWLPARPPAPAVPGRWLPTGGPVTLVPGPTRLKFPLDARGRRFHIMGKVPGYRNRFLPEGSVDPGLPTCHAGDEL